MDLTNGVSCIKGETHSLITLMRLNTRWATRSTTNKKFLKDSSSSSSSSSSLSSSLFYYYDDEDPHIQSFRQLNEYLEGIYQISDVDCLKYITPFHNIIISEQANGSLTSAALSSLSKFALYGFFQPHLPRIKEGLNLIVNSISQCVFEESDRESDEIILMKLLELSSLLFRCQASSLLSSENSWDVYSTCLSIYSHSKASKVLKSEAETTLVHITLNLFTRVSTLIGNGTSVDSTPVPQAQSQTNLPLSLPLDASQSSSSFKPHSSTSSAFLNLTSSSGALVSSEELLISTLPGATHLVLRVVKELSKKLQEKEEIQLGLFLINVALEAGGVALNCIPELIEILRHDVCRFLLRATQSDDLKVFSSSLRVVFNLFMSIKEHMKVQLEVFLTSVHLRLLNNSVGNISAREELALESLLEFCREPLLMQDLYANYDCDFQCTNIFDGIISTLAKRSIVEIGCVPEGPNNNSSLRKVYPHASQAKFDRTLLYPLEPKHRLQLQLERGRHPVRVTVLHRLAFDGLLAVLKSIVLKFSTLDGMILSQLHERKLLNKKRLHSLYQSGKSSGRVSRHEKGQDPSLESDSEVYEYENFSFFDEFDTCNLGTLTSPKDFEILTDEAFASAALDEGVSARGSLSFTPSGLSASTGGPAGSLLPPLSMTPSSSLVLSQIHNNRRLHLGTLSSNLSPNTRESINNIEELRQKRQAKQRIRAVVEAFNQAPLKSKWVSLALEAKLLSKITDEEIAENERLLEEVETKLAEASSSDSASASMASLTKKKNFYKLVSEGFKQSAKSYCSVHPRSFAQFFRDIPGLSREEIGVFISQGPADRHPLHSVVLHYFLQTFSFTQVPFGSALRMLLSSFRLPGEAQCIDRLMEAFARRYFEFADTITFGEQSSESSEPSEPLFASEDAVFILAFSTILLNTDLHNPGIAAAKKMSREDFIKNNRGINDGKNLPRDFLSSVYDEIRTNQIRVHSDSKAVTDFSDPQMWHKLIPKTNSSLSELPQFTSTFPSVRHRGSFSLPLSLQLNFNNTSLLGVGGEDASVSHPEESQPVIEFSELLECEIDMFLVISKGIFETLVVLFENVVDDTMLKRVLHGVLLYLTICSRLKLTTLFNHALGVLFYRLTHLFLLSNDFYIQNFSSLNFAPPYFGSIRGKYEIFAYCAIYEQWKKEEGHDLMVLLNTPVNSLFGDLNCSMLTSLFSSKNSPSTSPVPSSHRTSFISGETSPNLSSSPPSLCHSSSQGAGSLDLLNPVSMAEYVDWSEASMVKSQLMLNILLKIMTDFHASVGAMGWSSLLTFLLYARSRGALPTDLSKLECYLGGHTVENYEEKNLEQNLTKKKKSLPQEFLHPTVFSKGAFFSALNAYFRQGDLASTFNSVPPSGAPSSTPSSSTTSPTTRKPSSSTNNWGLFSIGEFLWSSNSDIYDEETTRVRELAYYLHDLKVAPSSSLSQDEKLFFYDTNFSPLISTPSSSILSGAQKNFLRTDDAFLATILLNNLPFLSVLKNSDSSFSPVEFDDSCLFSSLLEALIHILSTFHMSSQVLSDWHKSLVEDSTLFDNIPTSGDHFPQQFLPQEFKFFHQVSELDAVLVLEWIASHLLPSGPSSSSSAASTSPLLALKRQDVLDQRKEWFIKFLSSTFSLTTPASPLAPSSPSAESSSGDGEASDARSKSYLEDLSQKLPFFLERCVVLLFRLSLAELSSSAISSSPVPLTLTLLNLLNNLPSTFLLQISSLIGSGLISLVQYFYKLNVKIMKHEWQLFFNILLKIMNNFEGREKIWQIISIIIMEDLINRENYNEIKKILIQFITYSKINEEATNKKEHEEWALKSLLYLLRLCLIRLASYAYFNSMEIISSEIDLESSLDGDKKIYGFLTFPDPLEAKKGSISSLASSGSDNSLETSDTPVAASSATSWLTVPIIALDSNELSDFSLSLWVTSIVLFSDLCNAPSLRLIHRSLYCLEVSLLAARHLESGVLTIKNSQFKIKIKSLENITLPRDLWYKVMNEVLSRLPLNLTSTSQKFSSYSFSLSEIAEISYRACNILLKVFLDLFSVLKTIPNFNDFYLKLIQYFIHNASVSMKGQALHEEMIHMTIALLKILRLPPLNSSLYNLSSLSNISNQKSLTTSTPSTSSKTPKREQKSGGYLSVLSWINPFSSSPPPSSPAPASTQSSNTTVVSSVLDSNSEVSVPPEQEETSATPSITAQQYNELVQHDGVLLVFAWKLITSIYPSCSGVIRNWDPLLHKSLLHTVDLIESGKLERLLKLLPPAPQTDKEKEKEREKEREYRENFKENFEKKMLEKNKFLNRETSSVAEKNKASPSSLVAPSSPSSASLPVTSTLPVPVNLPMPSLSPGSPPSTKGTQPLSVVSPASPSSVSLFPSSVPLSPKTPKKALSSSPVSPPSSTSSSSVPLPDLSTSTPEKPPTIPSLSFPSSVASSEIQSPASLPQKAPSSPIMSLSAPPASSLLSSLPTPSPAVYSSSSGSLSSSSISPSVSSPGTLPAAQAPAASIPASSTPASASSSSSSTAVSSTTASTPSERPKASSTNIIIKAKYFDASSPIQIV